jgi:hypothetical protein
MKNIHILPTDKLSRLGRFIDTNNLFLRTTDDIPRGENINIYITSDEEIKEGDWFIFGVNESVLRMLEAACKANIKYNGAKKIMLTTDPQLIKFGVQAIDDDFLEWFVKNPSCEEIQVDKFISGRYFLTNPIIPKEEPKQETLEEALYKYVKDSSHELYELRKQCFLDGYKLGQERMYSEEDMAQSFMACWIENVPYGIECKVSFNEWFEQFKKK